MKAILYLLLRFNLVGWVATGAYLGIGLALGLQTNADPMAVHLIAFFVSVVVSFVGHAHFTFRRAGARYIFRFTATTLVLFLVSSSVTQLLAEIYGVSSALTVAVVTIGYPILSFVLHAAWTFLPPPADKKESTGR